MRRTDPAQMAERDSAQSRLPKDDIRPMIKRVATELSDARPAATLRSARRQFEREYVTLVLRHHRGRVGEAARALGIRRTNLYRKARQLGISVRAALHPSVPVED